MALRFALSISLLILGLPNGATLKAESPEQECKSTVTGTLEMIPLESNVFGNKRLLRVWLPPGYSEPVVAAKRYPVLYLFDGQMLFDRCTSQPFPDEWRVDETMTELIAKKRVEPLIVVGIDNAGPNRTDEYSRYSAVANAPQKLSAFMMTEVLPLIDGRYRTIGDRAHRGVGGASSPQPGHRPGRPPRHIAVPDSRPRSGLHHRVRRGVQGRGTEDYYNLAEGAADERHLRARQ